MQKNFSVLLRAYRRSRFLHHPHFFKVIGFILDEREDFSISYLHGQFLRDEGNETEVTPVAAEAFHPAAQAAPLRVLPLTAKSFSCQLHPIIQVFFADLYNFYDTFVGNGVQQCFARLFGI